MWLCDVSAYPYVGESKLVNLYPELDQFSQVDRKGQRYELAGEYTFRFGVEAKA
eukprot:COSAG06_NODE_28192_length_578_cov_101.970772_1_plen_53_part_10